jgi:hypothetical protein
VTEEKMDDNLLVNKEVFENVAVADLMKKTRTHQTHTR